MKKLKQKMKEYIVWPLFERFWCRGIHTWVDTPKDIMFPVEPYFCRWCRSWKGYKESVR
jgi:hypothetical protein